MSRERASVERCGIRSSFESGGQSEEDGLSGVDGPSVAVGRRKEVRMLGADFEV